MKNLSLRLRVFLFFLLIAVAGLAVIGAALFVGYQRATPEAPGAGYVLAGMLSGFGLLGVVTGVWFLFDDNVAKPIERIAARMRTRAHAGVAGEIDTDSARYLGDLAPAAEAVSDKLASNEAQTAEAVAAKAARWRSERKRLTALLTDIPIAMVIVNPSHQIVLYDGQAAELLGQVHMPRLNASIFDYFNADDLTVAYEQMCAGNEAVQVELRGAEGALTFDVRLKAMSQAPGYMILVDEAHALIAPEDTRPLIYDFDLSEHESEHAIEDKPVLSLNFVVFDTETTGLVPHRDDVVQLGAVRVVNGRIVPGEVIDQLVNPGRRIPPESTRVHKVTDAMVADAPGPVPVTETFHGFARDSVIVAHNAPFDMAFMKRYGKMAGLAWDHPILDTVLLSAVLFGASESHTLDALCARLEVEIPPELRHTALGDAVATAEVLCRMLPMLESRGMTTFGEVIAQTRRHGRLLQDMN